MNNVDINFSTLLGEADDAVVDQWELIASRRALSNLVTLLRREPGYDELVALIDATNWNSLAASRKALLDVRTAVYVEPLEALLRPQCEEAKRRIKQYLAQSDGTWHMSSRRASCKAFARE